MSLFGGSFLSEITRGSFWNTYIPVLTISSGATMSYKNAQGKYLIIGKVVFLHVNVTIDTASNPAAFISISLPFIPADSRFTTNQFSNASFLMGLNDIFGGASNTMWIVPIPQRGLSTNTAGIVSPTGVSIAGSVPIQVTLQGWYIKE